MGAGPHASLIMSERKFYKTTIHVEIVSEEPFSDGEELQDIVRSCITGGNSFKWDFVRNSEPIDGQYAASMLMDQGSDPGFFQLDEQGNDLED